MKQDANFFMELENTRPFLKMALQGFPKSGKTYTAVEIAIGLHKLIKSTKPIVAVDTEKALKALKSKFEKNNIKVQTSERRSLTDLVKAIELAEGGIADIVLIDSITHVWENFVQAYIEQKMQQKRLNSYQLQFQDWGILKPRWKKEFSDRLVLSNLHIIFTGRAGYEYDQEVNQDTGKKEIYKSGIKMKAENETAYEPDLLVYMERFEDLLGEEKKVWREATILGDRTDTIDGKTFKNPTFKDFQSCVKKLLQGEALKYNVDENQDVFPQDDATYYKHQKQREIELEKFYAEFDFLGTSARDKQIKNLVFEKITGTKSKTEFEGFPLGELTNCRKNVERLMKEIKEVASLEGDIPSYIDMWTAEPVETPENPEIFT